MVDIEANIDLIATASSCQNQLHNCHISDTLCCKRTGERYRVSHVKSSELSDSAKEGIFSLTECNMKHLYVKTWGWNPSEKWEELFSPKSNYILVHELDTLVAFAHFQFCMDDDSEPEFIVIYCFELQVCRERQGRGIGAQLVSILVAIGDSWNMQKLMLTTLKNHKGGSVDFYKKVGFLIDPGSPSCFGERAFYEIMSINLHSYNNKQKK